MNSLVPSENSTIDLPRFEKKCYDALNDDLNTPVLISHLFDGLKMINFIRAGQDFISEKDLLKMTEIYHTFVYDILGLKQEEQEQYDDQLSETVIRDFLTLRNQLKEEKDFKTADRIRKVLIDAGIEIKDTKDGFEWKITKR